MSDSTMERLYNHTANEKHWLKTRQENNVFRAENKTGQTSFSILLPPSPGQEEKNIYRGQFLNSLNLIIPDIIARRKKMQGFNVLYLSGLDRNNESVLLMNRLGISLDWNGSQFILPNETGKTAARVFVLLYKEGLIYQGDIRAEAGQEGNQTATPRISKQWFLKTVEIARQAIEVIEKGKIAFFPEIGKKEYLRWLNNVQDWRISRQFSVGQQIPVYYCHDCGSLMVYEEIPGECDRCNSTSITQDANVFDSCFSAALWPFAAPGWQDQAQDFKDFYPISLITVNPGTVFSQTARMIMMGIHFSKNVPFREILFNGRMREQKNCAVPADIIDKYGADVLRFSLAAQVVPARITQITNLSLDLIKGYNAFVNKIWHASRFVMLNLKKDEKITFENFTPGLIEMTDVDRWMLHGLNNMVVKVNDLLDSYKLHKAAMLIFRFFRVEFCNWYLEFSKNDMNNPTSRKIVGLTLSRLLQLLHPFMPFITEQIYHKFKPGENRFLIQTEFPAFSSDLVFPVEFTNVEVLKKVIRETRKTRTINGIIPKARLNIFLRTESEKEKKVLEKNMRYFDYLTGSAGTQIVTNFSILPRGFRGTCRNWEILLPFKSEEQRLNVLAQLEKEVEILGARIKDLENRLCGVFPDKIPETVITDFKKNLRTEINRRERIRKTINDLL